MKMEPWFHIKAPWQALDHRHMNDPFARKIKSKLWSISTNRFGQMNNLRMLLEGMVVNER